MKQFQELALDLADQARSVARKYFRQPLDIESKSDNTPVSIADREIERKSRDTISARYPDHGLFGEEYGMHNPASRWCWILDPIDGTKSFITGRPTYGSLIALLKEGIPVMGVIEIPALEERWWGITGEKTRFNGNTARTKCTTSLCEAVFCATSPDIFSRDEWPVFNQLSSLGKIRLFGGDCYNYGLLASGHVDVVMESDLKPYDFMALVPVIQAAGGVISDWQGKQLTMDSIGQVLASANSSLHELCLDQIARSSVS